jgi:TfoX/Sxy family transcriptional regulator of competence genes
MQWRKSPEELVNTFLAALPEDARVERRKMFGYPCAFVNGNMFTGLHQESLIVRLAEEDRQRLVEKQGARIFEPMPGRPMKEYVSLPDDVLDDAKELQGWIRRSLEYAAALPPKGAKKTATKAAKRAGASPAAKKSATPSARAASKGTTSRATAKKGTASRSRATK